MIQPLDLFMFSTLVNCIHCQFFISLFVSLLFDSVLFCFIHFCSIVQCLIICLFSVSLLCSYAGIVFQVIQYYKPHNNLRQVNKHHTPDCTIFCLSIGRESLLPSHTDRNEKEKFFFRGLFPFI